MEESLGGSESDAWTSHVRGVSFGPEMTTDHFRPLLAHGCGAEVFAEVWILIVRSFESIARAAAVCGATREE
jgi:hypothetical protein